MHFTFSQKVMFRHCDPAGIVFYPKHFEMLNDAVEALFADELGWPFEIMHADSGGPTVSLRAEFKAPARHGERLDFDITLKKLGSSSLTLHTRAHANGSLRFMSQHTMVCISKCGSPKPWPEPVRQRMIALMRGPSRLAPGP